MIIEPPKTHYRGNIWEQQERYLLAISRWWWLDQLRIYPLFHLKLNWLNENLKAHKKQSPKPYWKSYIYNCRHVARGKWLERNEVWYKHDCSRVYYKLECSNGSTLITTETKFEIICWHWWRLCTLMFHKNLETGINCCCYWVAGIWCQFMDGDMPSISIHMLFS